MTNALDNGGSPRWRWDHERLMDRNAAAIEVTSKELDRYERQTDEHLRQTDADIRKLLDMSARMETMDVKLDDLRARLDKFTASSATARQWSWQFAVQIITTIVVAIAAISSVLLTLARGVSH